MAKILGTALNSFITPLLITVGAPPPHLAIRSGRGSNTWYVYVSYLASGKQPINQAI